MSSVTRTTLTEPLVSSVIKMLFSKEDFGCLFQELIRTS